MTTREEFVQSLIESELMSPQALQEFIQAIPASDRPTNGKALARCLVKQHALTRFQADAVLKREFDRLSIGQYEVLEQIGAGGMGAVYKARHRRMNRIVAIKMIVRRHEDSADIVKRFEREVQVISGLQHPNIVAAHDADECEAGPFLVMEYVPGDDLDLIVRNNGPLSVVESQDCIIQSALGLKYAHSMNVIHRDIKPANLLRVDNTGCIKITDLGLARIQDSQSLSDSPVSSLTQTGNILGTVFFMAPEQSVDTKTVDHRCDIYSLGCTLYFLLHGRPPFMGDSRIDTIMLHRQGPIPSLREGRSDVPESLSRVFQRMLAKLPDDRFQTMADVVAALEACDVDPKMKVDAELDSRASWRGAGANTEDFRADEPTTVSLSVLLVEPSGAQAMVIRGFLESVGIKRIQRCRTGTEALQALLKFDADVVASAMHLDDMTGLRLAQRISDETQRKHMGFILISSSMDAKKLEDQTRGMGITLLAKPFDEKQLSDVLHRAVITRSGLE